MIPQDYITAWSRIAPWTSQRQIEQDLIISRALVAIFSDPFLHGELRFRGGTALNKLHFPAPLRYSEDIDLVRTTAGPISPLLDRLHDILDPWLGKPRFDQSPVAPKLRALLQRNKGRDLFDLGHALTVFEGLNTARIVECFQLYLEKAEVTISRAEAQQRMFQKLVNPTFFTDMRPLLQTDRARALTDETLKATLVRVMKQPSQCCRARIAVEWEIERMPIRSAQPQPVGGRRVAGLQRRQWLVQHQHRAFPCP